MSEARAICLACRSRIFASTTVARSRWLPRAGYATASPDAQSESHNDRTLDNPPAASEENPPDFDGALNRGPLVQHVAPQRDLTKPSQRKERSRRNAHTQTSIFQKIVSKEKEAKGAEEDQKQGASGFELYQNLAKLKELRGQSDVPLTACFDFFSSRIYPQLQAGVPLPKIFQNDLTGLFDDIQRRQDEDPGNGDLPTITQMTTIKRRLGFFKPQHWTPLIINLVEYISQMSTSPQDYYSTESFEGSQTLRAALLQDLIHAWRIFSFPQILLDHGELLHQAEDDFRLAPVRRERLARLSSPNAIDRALYTLFPQYVNNQLKTLAPAAISTVVLLTDPAKSNTAVQQSAQHFITAVTQILSAVPVDVKMLQRMFATRIALREYVLERWPSFAEQLDHHAEHPQARQHRKGLTVSKGKDPSILHKQLGQALKSRDLKACDKAWLNFWGPSNAPDPERAEILRQNRLMFDYFIMVYTAMRQPNKAVAVWNSLGKIGLAPSIKTWNSLIEGCKRASNAAGIRNVWARLVESGIQLDTTIWTTRISGLIDTGDPEGGLQALEEMARIWQHSLKNGTTPTAVKPTVEPVNAAIAGLLRYGANDAARKVLAWGSRHGIEPDIFTFNHILRPLVRQGATEEVDKVFAMMKSKGVQPDFATFTIILDGAMTSLGDQGPQQQIETVNRILAEMEAAGLEANLQTYGKMIYLLLQEGDRTQDSVKAVLAHIRGKGLEVSSHIYTMLAEHYFSRDPPDLAAVRDLIEKSGLYSKRGIDRVFWERVVRGYSQVGDTASALKAFRMIKGSMSVTTSTLSDLLQALINNEQWDEASQLARKAKSQRDLAQSDTAAPDARVWRHRFWHLVSQYGLLRDEPKGSEPRTSEPR